MVRIEPFGTFTKYSNENNRDTILGSCFACNTKATGKHCDYDMEPQEENHRHDDRVCDIENVNPNHGGDDGLSEEKGDDNHDRIAGSEYVEAADKIDNYTDDGVFLCTVEGSASGRSSNVDPCTDMKKCSVQRDTTKHNTIAFFCKEGRLKMANEVTERNHKRITQESVYIGAFLQAHGTSAKNQRHKTRSRSRDMSISEQRWVLEHRSKVFIERGRDTVIKGDYANWHVQGISDPKGLKDGISTEAIKRLCLRYDDWKHANVA